MRKGRKMRKGRDVSPGGMIYGPSHERGGIPMRIKHEKGSTMEVEGQEYLINAKAAKALGLPFLDKLNATANNYWPGMHGFGKGELTHLGSKFKNGGPIGRNNMRRRKMAGGTFTRGTTPYKHNLHNYHARGRTPYGTGGTMRNGCPTGTHMMQDGTCMDNNDPSMNMNRSTSGGGYRHGGRMGSTHPNNRYVMRRGRTYMHGGGVNTGSPCSGLDAYGRNCTH